MYLISSPLIKKKESRPENDSSRLSKQVWNGLFLYGNLCDPENKILLIQKVPSINLAQSSG